MRFALACFFCLYVGLATAQPPNYFQQEVNYHIQVALDDNAHELKGFEKIEYINNSPDALSYIYFHLWPNAYKNNTTALCRQLLENGEDKLYFAKDSERGFIDGLDFKSNGIPLKWELEESNIDICIVFLNEPLMPGEKVDITTPFRVKIPLGIYSRLGHMGQAYQITQWYPKPAVYDHKGWHPMPYLNQGEFYSEFGTYDVYITLPENYVVGATGDLVNGENEIAWLNEKALLTQNKTEFSSDMSFPPSSQTTKTLHYRQNQVHDFAWFADKRYHVLKGLVKLPHSGNTVTLWAMFTNSEPYLWMRSIEYLHDAVYFYSLWNGDYPYRQVTAVDGALSAGAGMEYPNVTVIGKSSSAFALETVIMHEVGHNWFYGILGSNERDHPWMDEGLNSLNELRYLETKYPDAGILGPANTARFIKNTFDIHQSHTAQYYLAYLLQARRSLDQPIEEKSQHYSKMNYGAIVYSKTAAAFNFLRAYLGNELFDKCMQAYYEKWKFKHTYPEDLRAVFEEITQKDLSWFFVDILQTTKKTDYHIGRIKKNPEDSTQYLVKIKNKGKIASPFSISSISGNEIHYTLFYEGVNKKTFVSFPIGTFKALRIDAEEKALEYTTRNNTIRRKGPFKKIEPIRLQWLGSLENNYKNQLFYTPIAGWNIHNGFMAGLAVYNQTVPYKKAEYVFAPMWAFKSQTPVGFSSLAYNFYPRQLFQHIRLATNARSFSHYAYPFLTHYKLAPEADIRVKNKDYRSRKSYHIYLRHLRMWEEQNVWIQGNSSKNLHQFYVNQLVLSLKNTEPINPYTIILNTQQSIGMLKTSLEASIFFRYKEDKNKGFGARFFIGRILNNQYNDPRFNLTFSERPDYLYDDLYLGRNAGNFLNQQYTVYEGGFKNLMPVRSFNRWLNAINLSTTIPKVPIKLYADLGFAGFEYQDASGNLIDDASEPVYLAGIAYQVIPQFCEIYFPLLYSHNPNALKYAEKIRFTLYLSAANPFKAIRTIQF